VAYKLPNAGCRLFALDVIKFLFNLEELFEFVNVLSRILCVVSVPDIPSME